MTLTYDPSRGYIWDHRVEMTVKKGECIRKSTMEVTDPFFYQIPRPATDKLPVCADGASWAIWTRPNGLYGRLPLNHDGHYDGIAQAKASGGCTIAPGGVWATTLNPDYAAVIELPQDNEWCYYGEYCHWGYDLHIRASGHKWSETFAEGDLYRGHARYYARDAGEIANASLRATVPSPGNLGLLRFVYEEPVNSFNRLIPLASFHRERIWLGDYTHDATTGHNSEPERHAVGSGLDLDAQLPGQPAGHLPGLRLQHRHAEVGQHGLARLHLGDDAGRLRHGKMLNFSSARFEPHDVYDEHVAPGVALRQLREVLGVNQKTHAAPVEVKPDAVGLDRMPVPNGGAETQPANVVSLVRLKGYDALKEWPEIPQDDGPVAFQTVLGSKKRTAPLKPPRRHRVYQHVDVVGMVYVAMG